MRACSLWLSIMTFASVCLAGCTGGKETHSFVPAFGGNADRGRQAIVHYKCGSCHTIPGIRHAHGVFGPPLNWMGSRSMIAGNFPNTPSNMVRWVMAPTSIKPRTTMPDLGLTEQQAKDVAAYLETLRATD